jgi:hypothetical protein
MDSVFNDRRPSASPGDDDYSTPVNRDTLIDANARLRAATPHYQRDRRNTTISTLAVQRHRARMSGLGDFASVGHYLDFLQGSAE